MSLCYFKIKVLKKENKTDTFSEPERIHHQHNGTANIKQNVLAEAKIIPDVNLDLNKEIKSTRNGKYVGKFNISSYFICV